MVLNLICEVHAELPLWYRVKYMLITYYGAQWNGFMLFSQMNILFSDAKIQATTNLGEPVKSGLC